jgi:hypothetical protein
MSFRISGPWTQIGTPSENGVTLETIHEATVEDNMGSVGNVYVAYIRFTHPGLGQVQVPISLLDDVRVLIGRLGTDGEEL